MSFIGKKPFAEEKIQNKRICINDYNIKEYDLVVLILIDTKKECEPTSSIWIHGLENY